MAWWYRERLLFISVGGRLSGGDVITEEVDGICLTDTGAGTNGGFGAFLCGCCTDTARKPTKRQPRKTQLKDVIL